MAGFRQRCPLRRDVALHDGIRGIPPVARGCSHAWAWSLAPVCLRAGRIEHFPCLLICYYPVAWRTRADASINSANGQRALVSVPAGSPSPLPAAPAPRPGGAVLDRNATLVRGASSPSPVARPCGRRGSTIFLTCHSRCLGVSAGAWGSGTGGLQLTCRKSCHIASMAPRQMGQTMALRIGLGLHRKGTGIVNRHLRKRDFLKRLEQLGV